MIDIKGGKEIFSDVKRSKLSSCDKTQLVNDFQKIIVQIEILQINKRTQGVV